jgi:hypothetical protein
VPRIGCALKVRDRIQRQNDGTGVCSTASSGDIEKSLPTPEYAAMQAYSRGFICCAGSRSAVVAGRFSIDSQRQHFQKERAARDIGAGNDKGHPTAWRVRMTLAGEKTYAVRQQMGNHIAGQITSPDV